jgi:hypothetical protein
MPDSRPKPTGWLGRQEQTRSEESKRTQFDEKPVYSACC